ncbi:MAG: DUF6625 family protein [Vicinamibacterales bacterium]
MFNWLKRSVPQSRPVVVRPGPPPVRPPIAVVVAYFGRLPAWSPAFFVTARKNPDIQFLLYTDMDLPAGTVGNITIRHMEIADFNRRATEVIGTPIEVQHHVAKTNDLKPVFGLMFEDDLKGFDYWAYSDFDVAWGDIRRFVTDELLHSHDLISSRKDKLCGHFTLFRNAPEYNRTWELIPDVIKAMGCPTHMHLDEVVFTKSIRGTLGQWPLTSASRIYWKSNWTIDAKYQRDMGHGPNDVLWWRDGRTFDVEGQEMMYLHFHKLKMHMKTINFTANDSPSSFYIDRKGIFA